MEEDEEKLTEYDELEADVLSKSFDEEKTLEKSKGTVKLYQMFCSTRISSEESGI